MKLVVAPDSFKGSLEAIEICHIAEKVAHRLFETVEVVKLPMADGGEGTVNAMLDALHGERVTVSVHSPDQRMIQATYGLFDGHKAVMEMAQASGITLVEHRDLWQLNTYGTGEMILDALNRGVDTIYLGIGGSATNDGGLGFASALGVKFLDKQGMELPPVPASLNAIAQVDQSGLDARMERLQLIIMSDVKNPLLGEKGASAVFGPQKGATPEMVVELNAGLTHLSQVVPNGVALAERAGAGGAGGLGFGLLAFTKATMQSGVETILELLQMEQAIEGADLVLTGEGRMDGQSAFGKVAYGVGRLCKKHEIPCVAIVGSLGQGYQEMYNHGITSMITTVDGIMTLETAMEQGEQLCEAGIERALRLAGCCK